VSDTSLVEDRAALDLALAAIAANARRLLSDAELLFSHGRDAAAVTLAVLSVEEVGKFFLHKWQHQEQASLRSARRHDNKQRVVGVFDQADAATKAILDLVEIFENRGSGELSSGPQSLAWFFLDEEARGNFLHKLLMSDACVDPVAKASGDASSKPMTRNALNGELSAVKNSSLYVDVNSEGNMRSDPSTIDAPFAVKYLDYARSVVARLIREEKAKSPDGGPSR
jgi:hypothetical protein